MVKVVADKDLAGFGGVAGGGGKGLSTFGLASRYADKEEEEVEAGDITWTSCKILLGNDIKMMIKKYREIVGLVRPQIQKNEKSVTGTRSILKFNKMFYCRGMFIYALNRVYLYDLQS